MGAHNHLLVKCFCTVNISFSLKFFYFTSYSLMMVNLNCQLKIWKCFVLKVIKFSKVLTLAFTSVGDLI